MATATQPNAAQAGNAQATNDSGNVTSVREDIVIGTEQGKSKNKDDQEVTTTVPVLYSPDKVASAEFKTEHPTFAEAYRVTTQISKPLNLAGIKEVIGDNEAEAGRLFFNGAQQKVTNRMNKFLLEQEDDGSFTYLSVITGGGEDKSGTWTGSYVDLDEQVRSESKRKMLTEEEKMIRALSNMPDAVALPTFNAWRVSTGLSPVTAFPRS